MTRMRAADCLKYLMVGIQMSQCAGLALNGIVPFIYIHKRYCLERKTSND